MDKKLPIDEFENYIMTAGGNLYLTNYRIRYYTRGIYYSIRLSEISYLEFEKKYRLWIMKAALWLAGILLAFQIFDYYNVREPVNLIPAVMVLLLGVILYFTLTAKTIRIASSGGAIEVNADSLTNPEIDRFIELAENAIFEFTTRKPVYRIQ